MNAHPVRRSKLVLSTVLCLCASQAWSFPFFGSRVTTEYDHAALLAGRTYSWGGLHMDASQYEPAVRAAADKYLQARGWQLVSTGGSTEVWGNGNIRGEAQLETFYAQQGDGWGAGQWSPQGLGPGWAPGFGQATTSAVATPENHLVLDIFDAGSRRLVFRGVTAVDFSGSDKQNQKQLAGSLKTMFKKFPPKK